MKIALYPGTFDPITLGHIDVLTRASRVFDKIIIAVGMNTSKHPIFTIDERIELIRENLPKDSTIEVDSFSGLTVDFAHSKNASAIIRGLRAVSDFEYEFQMAQMNRQLNSNIETFFLMPSEEYFYISSKLIRSIAETSPERIAKFVPHNVLQMLIKKYNNGNKK